MKLLFILGSIFFLSNIAAQTYYADIRGTSDVNDGGKLQLATPSANHYLRLYSGSVGDARPFLYFNELDTFRIASGISDFSNFRENLTLLNGLGTGASSTTFVGIGNKKPTRELDIRTNDLDDGSEINIGNIDNSHFLRFFSGRQNFPYPVISWKQGDSLSMGTDENTYKEILRLRDDGTMVLNSNKGISLDAGDRPLITRGWNNFTTGSYAGIGRWGLFMEPNYLTFGVPALPLKGFQFVAYNEDGTISNTLLRLKDGKVGFNNTDPQYLVDVNGDANFTGTIRVNGDPGTSGQVLSSNGTSDPTWTTVAGGAQVGFSAYLTSNKALNTNTSYGLGSFTESNDDGMNFNPLAGTFSAPSAGLYVFTFNANWNTTVSPITDIPTKCDIIVNNVAVHSQAGSISLGSVGTAGATYGDGLTFTFIRSLNNGDQVRLSIWQDGLSTITLAGGTGLITTWFSGYKIY